MTQHPNSRKITIFRAPNFMQISQNPNGKDNEATADFMALSSQGIGPFYESFTAKIMGTGLTLSEQALLMPHILNIEPGDKDFKKAVYDFFNGINTKIPFASGKELEIGLEESNDKPLSATNMPIKIEDYIRYRHVKKHPWVAGSQKEAKGNQLKYFYIHDTDAQFQEDTDKLVLQDEADEIYLKVKNQPQKVTMLLTMFGEDERDYLGIKGEARKLNKLKEIVSTQAPQFLKVYNEDRFEMRYWLKAMVKAGIVEQVGDESYVVRETKKLLGRKLMDTLLYLEDEKNADVLTYLKAQTQDVLRKPKASRKPLPR